MANTGTKALRVLMVNTLPMAYDGITMVMLNYAGNMEASNLRVDLVAQGEVETALRHRVQEIGAALYVVPGRNRRPLTYVLRLARLIRKNGYQVVHAHGNSCTLALEMLAARLGGARARCPHSHNTTCTARRANKLLRPLFDRLYTHGFACGEAAGRWLFRDRPFEVLKNGIDVARFAFDDGERQKTRALLGLEGRVVVGHVGHFTEQKNHRFLIEAFARAHAANARLKLVLVGEGPLEPEIRALARARSLEDDVLFLGTTRQIPQILCAMDIMALPSLYEGLPNVLVEWQANGLTALVSDRVTEEARLTGLLRYMPLDEAAWAEALAGATERGDRAEACAQAARAVAEAGYDIKTAAARLRGLYQAYVASGVKN